MERLSGNNNGKSSRYKSITGRKIILVIQLMTCYNKERKKNE